jgi:RNA polymerase sigma factor (sigma-70 family)
MRDRDIVAAIVAGDPAGLAAAYDSYAASLYGYCRSLLGEPADAADAVQDTFVIAAAKLGGLRSPSRLRPWLYAVARNECHGRLRARSRQADLDEAVEMTDEGADVGGAAQRGELRDLVLDAVAGLNQGDREVIELNLRHDLGGADLAGVLGVPVNQAHALASRARGQLERALGALLVARTGRRDCIILDDILENWDGRLTVLMRKRIGRHIADCEVCTERKSRVLSPAALLSLLPLVPLPLGLRQHVLRLVSDDSPEAVGYKSRVISRAGQFDPAGFPVQHSSPRPSRGSRRKGGGAGGVGGLLIGLGGGHGGERSAMAVLAAAAVAVLLVGGGSLTIYELTSGSSPAPAAHRKTVAGEAGATVQPSEPGGPLPPGSNAPQIPPGTQPGPAGEPSAPAATTSAPPVKPSTPKPSKSASPSPSPSSSATASPSPTPTVSLPFTPPPSSSPSPSPSDSSGDTAQAPDLIGIGISLTAVLGILPSG